MDHKNLGCDNTDSSKGMEISLQGLGGQRFNANGPNEANNESECKCQRPPQDGVEMSWKEVAFALWKLLDDVDTAGDMAKGNDAVYRKIVERLHGQRCLYLVSRDGMTLDPMVKIDEPNDVAKAIEALSDAMTKDPELRETWHANIAMTLHDNYQEGFDPAERNHMADALLAHLFKV